MESRSINMRRKHCSRYKERVIQGECDIVLKPLIFRAEFDKTGVHVQVGLGLEASAVEMYARAHKTKCHVMQIFYPHHESNADNTRKKEETQAAYFQIHA